MYIIIDYLIRASAWDGINSRSMILHDCSSAAFHGQDASHLQDDILRRGPARQSSCQPHSNHLVEQSHTGFSKKKYTSSIPGDPWKKHNRSKWKSKWTNFGTFELPGDSSHDIHSVCSTHSYTDAPEATAIGSVGVCTNQHHTRIGIVLQDNLVFTVQGHSGSLDYYRFIIDC